MAVCATSSGRHIMSSSSSSSRHGGSARISSPSSSAGPGRGDINNSSSNNVNINNINSSRDSGNAGNGGGSNKISQKIQCLSEILHSLDDGKARSARATTPSHPSSFTTHVTPHVWPQYLSAEAPAANGSVTARAPSRGSYSQHLYSHVPYNQSDDTRNHHHHRISPYQLSTEKPPPSPYADELLLQQYCSSKSLDVRASDLYRHSHHHYNHHYPYLSAVLDGSHDHSRSFLYHPSASNSSPLSATSRDVHSLNSVPLDHLPSCINMASKPQRSRPLAESYGDDDHIDHHDDHSSSLSGVNAFAREILTRLERLEQSQHQAAPTGINCAKPRVSKRRSTPPGRELRPRIIHNRRRSSVLRSIKRAAEDPADDHTCDTDTKGETSSLDPSISGDQLVKQVQRLETEVQVWLTVRILVHGKHTVELSEAIPITLHRKTYTQIIEASQLITSLSQLKSLFNIFLTFKLCWSAINQLCIDNELFREEQRRWSRYVNPQCLWGDDAVTKKTKLGAKKDRDYYKKTKRKGFNVEEANKDGEAL